MQLVNTASHVFQQDLMPALPFFVGRSLLPALARLRRKAKDPVFAVVQAIHLICMALEPADQYKPGPNSLILLQAVIYELGLTIVTSPYFRRQARSPILCCSLYISSSIQYIS